MAKPSSWFSIEAKAAEGDAPSRAVVNIYDEIGERWYGSGTGAKSFAEQIAALDVDVLEVHLNSPGGAAWDGVTIMNALRQHRATVEVTVDGLAASAASCIAMAGDTVTMSRGSMMMIHDASGGAYGNAGYLKDTAAILDKLSDSYADVYAAKAGKDRAHWRELMRAETWYTAEEAVEAGLADAWSDAEPDPDSRMSAGVDPRARYVMTARSRAVPVVLPEVEASAELPSSTEPGDVNDEEVAMCNGDLKVGVIERLGLTDADASDEQILTALEEALTAPAATAELPQGVTVIDEGVLAQLQSDAAAGREALETQARERREAAVAAAVREGRITPAAADAWAQRMKVDEEGTTALLGTLAKGSAAPVSELGHEGEPENAEDALYAAIFGGETEGV